MDNTRAPYWLVFLKTIPPTQPVLLIEDGHSSHVSIQVIKLACKKHVHLLHLPFHTTHPTPANIFKFLKSHYSKEAICDCPSWTSDNGRDSSITYILGKNGLSIMAGFRKSSAYPLNLGVKKDRQVAPSLTGNPFGSKESVTDVKSSPGSENS